MNANNPSSHYSPSFYAPLLYRLPRLCSNHSNLLIILLPKTSDSTY